MRYAVCGFALLCSAALAANDGSAVRIIAAPAITDAQFCGTIQRILAGTTLPADNTVQRAFDDFVKAKPTVRPLRAQQYVEYDDSARTQPKLIACKTKSADHLNAEYGSGAALGDDYPCRSINRSIVLSAWSAMTASQKSSAAWPPSRIMLDGDDVGALGSTFVKPYAFLYVGADGLPHLQARAQYAGWTDWRWKWMPDRFRGTHYCRLIAPEYARRLIRGDVALPPEAKPPGADE